MDSVHSYTGWYLSTPVPEMSPMLLGWIIVGVIIGFKRVHIYYWYLYIAYVMHILHKRRTTEYEFIVIPNVNQN